MGFKNCPACGKDWVSREALLADGSVSLIGYQAHFEELKEGLFLFNHSCKGTFALPAGIFVDLYTGPIFRKRATGTDECPGHCLHEDELAPCPAHCECAYVREVCQIVQNWPKKPQPTSV